MKERLNAIDRASFDLVRTDMDDAAATTAIQNMTDYLYQYHGKKALILLDEYDTPLQEAYANGYWEELTQFIRSLFNSAFKTNPYMERGLLTGIYNPWSITCFLEGRLYKPYWANSSSNRLVSRLIRQGDPQTKVIMEDLLQGRALSMELDEEISMTNWR